MDLTEDMFDRAFIQVDSGVYEDHGSSSDSDSDDYEMIHGKLSHLAAKNNNSDGSSEAGDSAGDTVSATCEDQNKDKFKIMPTTSNVSGTKLLRAEVRLTPLPQSTINHVQGRKTFDMSDRLSEETNNWLNENIVTNVQENIVVTDDTKISSLATSEVSEERIITGVTADSLSLQPKSSSGKGDEKGDKGIEKEGQFLPSKITLVQFMNGSTNSSSEGITEGTDDVQNIKSHLGVKAENKTSERKNCSSSCNDHPYSMPMHSNTNNENDDSDYENPLCIDEADETEVPELSDKSKNAKTMNVKCASSASNDDCFKYQERTLIEAVVTDGQSTNVPLETNLKHKTDFIMETISSKSTDGQENSSKDEEFALDKNKITSSMNDNQLTLYGESDSAIVNCHLLCNDCVKSVKNDALHEEVGFSSRIVVKKSDCESCKSKQKSVDESETLNNESKSCDLGASEGQDLDIAVKNSAPRSNLENVIDDVARNFSKNAVSSNAKHEKQLCQNFFEEALKKLAKDPKSKKKKNNVIFLQSKSSKTDGKPVLANGNSIIIQDDKMQLAIKNAYKNVKTTETAEIDGKIYKVIVFSKAATSTKTSIISTTALGSKPANEITLKNTSQGNVNLSTFGRCLPGVSASSKLNVIPVTTAASFNVPSKMNLTMTTALAPSSNAPMNSSHISMKVPLSSTTSSNQNLRKIMSTPPSLSASLAASVPTPNKKLLLPVKAVGSVISSQSNSVPPPPSQSPIRKGISLLSSMKTDVNKSKESSNVKDLQNNVSYQRVNVDSPCSSPTKLSNNLSNKFISITDFFHQKHASESESSSESGPIISATFSLAPKSVEIVSSEEVSNSMPRICPKPNFSKSLSFSNGVESVGKRTFNQLNSFNTVSPSVPMKRPRIAESQEDIKNCVATKDFLDDASKNFILNAVLLPPFMPVVLDSVYDAFNPPARFKCLQCTDTFTSINHLKIHMNRRTALMKYDCPLCCCEATFYNRCMLKQHCQTHNVEVDLKHLTIELLPFSLLDLSVFDSEAISLKSDVSSLGVPTVIPSHENYFSSPNETQKKPTKRTSRSTEIRNETNLSEVALKNSTPNCAASVSDIEIENFKAKNAESTVMLTPDAFTSAHHALEFFEQTEADKKTSGLINGGTENGIMKMDDSEIVGFNSSISCLVQDKTVDTLTSSNRLCSSVNRTDVLVECSECNEEYASLLNHFQNSGKPRFELTCACKKVLTSPCSLKAHSRLHDELPPHTCPECGVKVLCSATLTEHFKKSCFHLAKKSSFECLKCKQNFASLQSLERHILKSHTSQINVCGVCEISDSDSATVSDHLQREHTDSTQLDSYKVLRFLKCDFCPLAKFPRQQCRKHIQSHITTRSSFRMNYYYSCDVCSDFKTVSKLTFAQHIDLCSFSTILESLSGDADDSNSKLSRVEEDSTEPKNSVLADTSNDCSKREVHPASGFPVNDEMLRVTDDDCVTSNPRTEFSKFDHDLNDSENDVAKNCDSTMSGGQKSVENVNYSDPPVSSEPSTKSDKKNRISNESSKKVSSKKSKYDGNSPDNKNLFSANDSPTPSKFHSKQNWETNCDDPSLNSNFESENQADRLNECSKCSFVGRTYNDLFNHMETHKSIYVCKECSKTFVVRPSLEKHLVLHHNFSAREVKLYIEANNLCPEVLKENGAYHAHQGFYQCATCYKNFPTEDLFSQHFRSHGMAYVNDSLVSNLAD